MGRKAPILLGRGAYGTCLKSFSQRFPRLALPSNADLGSYGHDFVLFHAVDDTFHNLFHN